VIVGKRRITVNELLRFLADFGDEFMDLSRQKVAQKIKGQGREFNLNDYFPSVTEKIVGRLLRIGDVEKISTPDGIKIRLTEKGKKRTIFLKINDIRPETGVWDGKWRVVFFDIEETKRLRRDRLRGYMEKIGLKQMQRSVWVSPYDIDDEIKYLREILEVPNDIKLGLLEKIENEEELRDWFNLK
jgi:hypothetical protein